MPIDSLVKTMSAGARLGWAITREAGASVLTYELYPLGIIRSVPVLSSPWVEGPANRVPVLFLHGVFHNPSTFAWHKQRLAWAGWRQFGEINLFSSLRPIHTNAEMIGKAVDDLRARYNSPQVDIVAHSMGGILARYYVQLLAGDGKVRQLITLATPHQGTQWSRYSVFPTLREIAPGSATISRLNNSPPPRVTQAIAISGALDFLMRPQGCEQWEGVRNIRLKKVGHAGLLFSKRVSQILISHLSETACPPYTTATETSPP